MPFRRLPTSDIGRLQALDATAAVVFQPKWDSRQVSQGGLFCGGHNP